MAGYHKRKIERGTLGSFSKIREEYEEMLDAYEQNNPVMMLHEMSDLLGAMEAVVKKYNLDLYDLIEMKNATSRAFEDGTRIKRD